MLSKIFLSLILVAAAMPIEAQRPKPTPPDLSIPIVEAAPPSQGMLGPNDIQVIAPTLVSYDELKMFDGLKDQVTFFRVTVVAQTSAPEVVGVNVRRLWGYPNPGQCDDAALAIPGFDFAACHALASRYFKFAGGAINPISPAELQAIMQTHQENSKRAKLTRAFYFVLSISTAAITAFPRLAGRDGPTGVALAGGTLGPALGALFPDRSGEQQQRLQQFAGGAGFEIPAGGEATILIGFPNNLLFSKDSWAMMTPGVKGSQAALEFRQMLNTIFQVSATVEPKLRAPAQQTFRSSIARP